MRDFDQTEEGWGFIPTGMRKRYINLTSSAMGGLSYVMHAPLVVVDEIGNTANSIFPWGYDMVTCTLIGNCGPAYAPPSESDVDLADE